MDKKTQFNTWYVIAAVLLVLFVQNLWIQSKQVEAIPYSEFRAYMQDGRINEVFITDNRIRGVLTQPDENGARQIVSILVEPSMTEDLERYGVKFSGAIESTLLRDILSWILPILVFFGLWMLVIRKVIERQGLGGGMMSIGQSKAKVYLESDTKVTFDDVAGVDEAKAELEEIVDFLKNPDSHGRLGGRIPKGVLLVGPPGCGKTLLARAVAGEAAVPFFSISGSEFVEMFVGVGAARVRDMFEQARARAPAIIFIDELDALGRARGAFPGMGGHDEKEQTLNQLLSELDGFDPSRGLVLLAATNRPEILDPALLRAGRFDRQVLVDRPDKIGRIQILNVHLTKVTLASDVVPAELAALTPGFSGADLANLINEAALLATRRNADAVSAEDFTMAIERIVAGLEKRNRLLNPFERKVVAYHEMGHALVALTLPTNEQVHKVSIIPRGIGSLGYTIQRPTEDRYLMTADELENKMAVLLGGRAAEHIVFDHLSTGASDDLAKATEIARNMVTRYGMNEKLGQVVYQTESGGFLGIPTQTPAHERTYSEETAREIDCAIREIVDRVFAKTEAILNKRRETLDKAAAELLEHETLNEEQITAIVGRTPNKTPL
jgi:cell division protease FtsH